MTEHLRKLSPGRIVVLGFAFVILTGSLILWLPISANEGVDVSYIDALFTSTSAVCVTGLIAVDTADTFNVFGRTVVALLIQVGGLGVTCVGVGVILLAGKKIGIHGRVLIRDSMNLTTVKGVVRLVEAILFMTCLLYTSMNAKKRHNRVLKMAKGYRGARSKQYRVCLLYTSRSFRRLSHRGTFKHGGGL